MAMRITLEQILDPTIDLQEAIANQEAFDLEGNIAYVLTCNPETKHEIDEWCEITLTSEWGAISTAFSIVVDRVCVWSFCDEDDALLFKLAWM